MVITSRWQVSIPDIYLPSLLFTSPTHPLSTTHRCFSDADRSDSVYLTAHGLRLWCQRFALGLRRAGLQRGDRLMLVSGNSVFFPVVFLGTVMAGGIFTGASQSSVARELAYQLADSGAVFLLSARSSLGAVRAAAAEVGLDEERVYVFEEPASEDSAASGDPHHWHELLASVEDAKNFAWDALTTRAAAEQTVLALNYSSGTTGLAKSVAVTHRNYVANSVQIHDLHHDRHGQPRAQQARYLCFFPFYHAMAQTVFIALALLQAAPAFVMAGFDFEAMLRHIARSRITNLVLVPPVAVALTTHPAARAADLTSIDWVAAGGSPLTREVCGQVEALLRGVKIKQGWGMTEITSSMLGWKLDEDSTGSSVGSINANCAAKIMADDGVTECGVDQPGELWVRGPNVMLGYWNKPAETAEVLDADGWLHTSDVSYVDAADHFYIVDRKKDLIKVKGYQVAPAELEQLLLKHPGIVDAAVVGKTVNLYEFPRAYVVRRPGETVSPEAIHDFINERVAPIKRLTGGIIFVEAIPRNTSGKILRRELRDRANKDGSKL